MLNNEKMREKNISMKFWILKKNTKEYLKYTFFFFGIQLLWTVARKFIR